MVGGKNHDGGQNKKPIYQNKTAGFSVIFVLLFVPLSPFPKEAWYTWIFLPASFSDAKAAGRPPSWILPLQ